MPEIAALEEVRHERDAATIGIVEAVSPGRIDVAILHEAPHGTGLREGSVHHFPRINSYVVLPSERGSILAMVTWVGIDDEQLAARTQRDQIGLPVPRRRLQALPLGVLRRSSSLTLHTVSTVVLDRGVLLFPTVGDPVRLPTKSEAVAVLPTSSDSGMSIPIGHALLAGDADVRLDPNRLFGRHLAILGNTGSGKSCSVAQLLRASITAIDEQPTAFNAIILDTNGEYAHAFDGIPANVSVRHFSVEPESSNSSQFRVPYWLWNYREWLSFSEASSRGQAPQLRRCLHLLRTHEVAEMPRAVVSLIGGRRIVRMYHAGAIEGNANSNYLSVLDNVLQACGSVSGNTPPAAANAVTQLSTQLTTVLQSRRGKGDYLWNYGAHPLNLDESETLLTLFNQAIKELGVPEFLDAGLDVDIPIPFDADNLIDLLPLMAADTDSEAVGWVAPLVERLRVSMADQRQRSICAWTRDETLREWLQDYVPDGTASQITVIDLSLVPTNVVQVVVAAFTRIILEAMERQRRLSPDEVTPRILVVEEAHSLIRRPGGSTGDDQAVSATRLCREAFERVAREGRKFGLSLVISSQRPSELSETVLSQCNTYIVHRIVNDQDQRLVRRLVPDNLSSLMEELPALPSQTALVVGWALDIPALVRISYLDKSHRPRSADPDFAGTWNGDRVVRSDWDPVVSDWQPNQRGARPTEPAEDEPF